MSFQKFDLYGLPSHNEYIFKKINPLCVVWEVNPVVTWDIFFNKSREGAFPLQLFHRGDFHGRHMCIVRVWKILILSLWMILFWYIISSLYQNKLFLLFFNKNIVTMVGDIFFYDHFIQNLTFEGPAHIDCPIHCILFRV